MIGQTVLHYKILEKLGEGGMGVVYRAEDTTLHRSVALKFLPEKATGSPMDKARFLQEARAAANLNHPNICTIHAVEESEGKTFIAMEYVEGTTLRERIPFRILNSAYDIAIQIGEALAEAHAKGIVHRDVKAENIMVTPKGQAKVMDFGLAKLKGSLKLTRTSSTVGTLGYMSPEQIQGGEVDHRSDIFSLGGVLFEMVTGQLPFRGEHEAAIVYSIVNEAPKKASDIVPGIPQGLEDIFAKAFEKDPNERYQSAADLAVDLKRLKKQSASHSRSNVAIPRPSPDARPASSPALEAVGAAAAAGSSPPTGTAGSGKGLTFLIGGLLLFALGYIGWLQFRGGGAAAPTPILSARLTEQAGEESMPDLSPDGNYIAYVREEGTRADIIVQRSGGGNPLNLTSQSGDWNTSPAYSPKGDLIAFRSERDGGGIFIMGSTGESVRRLTDFGYNPAWSPDGKWVVLCTEGITHPYSRTSTSKIWKIDASSGAKELLYNGDGVQPAWSPDGQWITFWGLPQGTGRRELFVIRSGGGEPLRLTDDQFIDWHPRWDADGKAIYFLSDRGGTMNVWKAGFDPGTGTLAGMPMPVTVPSQNCTGLSIARDGSKFVYEATDDRANIYSIPFDPERLTTAGKPTPVTQGSKSFGYISLSPDGRSIAFTIRGAQEDIGIIGADGSNFRKLTNDRPKDRGPDWSPDGRKLAFYSERAGKYQIYTINTDGSGLTRVTNEQSSQNISLPLWFPNGNRIEYSNDSSGAVLDLSRGTGDSGTTGTLLPVFRTVESNRERIGFNGSEISSDGGSILGQLAREDGKSRGIAVYSMADSSYRVLRKSGFNAKWIIDGRSLIFSDSARLMALDLASGKETTLPEIPISTNATDGSYVVSTDGRTIYFIRSEAESDLWEARLR